MNWEIDQPVWQGGPWSLDLNLLFSWLVMALLVGGSWLMTRKLALGPTLTGRQCFVEGLVEVIAGQIRDVTQQSPQRYLPFAGTLFLFIAMSNALTLIPGFLAPTSSVVTTSALAVCVFFAVPIYGIADRGWRGYFAQYLRPTPFMLPFHVMGELSRTLALAVRLFGNMMSGAKIAAILLAIVPFLVPIPLTALSLLTGFIQAYIFAILAMVYIASATQAHDDPRTPADVGAEPAVRNSTMPPEAAADKEGRD